MRKLLLLLICSMPIMAEVEKVTISWTPGLCHQACVNLLHSKFQKIPYVESLTINHAEGMAEFAWKPTNTFSFVLINNAMRYVGIRETSINMRVRGRVQVKGHQAILISKGDRTRFFLLNSLPTEPEYIIQNSSLNQQLTPEMRQLLMDGQKNNQIAVVEGPLFYPGSMPGGPLQLVIDQISFEEKEKPKP